MPIARPLVCVLLAVYIIFEIPFPRLGLIRVEAFDQGLVELRNTMT